MTSVVGTILLVHVSHFILEGLVGTLSVTSVPIALNRDKLPSLGGSYASQTAIVQVEG